MGTSHMSRVAIIAALVTLSGCSIFQPRHEPPPPPEPPKPQYAEPLATHTFPYDPKTTAVVGTLQATIAREEDTLSDIARRFNLGYDEVVNANPGVDPWLPREGTRIVLPTQFILPESPHDGVVVNLAALRLFYFPKPAKGEQRVVVTMPIGIGMVGWATPEGATKIVSKRKDPVWTPPESVRKEHAAEGDILPAGVGMRASHGCIRLYPEDIATLFPQLPVGTKVTVVNQPLLYKAQDGQFYVQSYPPHEEHPEAKAAAKGKRFNTKMQNRMTQRAKPSGVTLDWPLVEQVVNASQGITVPVSQPATAVEQFLASARLVENRIPTDATWDGSDRRVPIRNAAASPVAAAGGR